MRTEVPAEEGGGITGFGVVLLGGYLFGMPERGDGWDMLEDILGSFGELDFWGSWGGTFSHGAGDYVVVMPVLNCQILGKRIR
jgi:hypothetical protein